MHTEDNSKASSRRLPEETLRSHLELMMALEASLGRSRKALVDLDLESLNRCTAEQVFLSRELAAILDQVRGSQRPIVQASDVANVQLVPSELRQTLRQTQSRVFTALQLQSALLARLQCKLCVLANMRAGLAAPYGVRLGTRGGSFNSSFLTEIRGKGSELCRV
jgi:hypothetical protein